MFWKLCSEFSTGVFGGLRMYSSEFMELSPLLFFDSAFLYGSLSFVRSKGALRRSPYHYNLYTPHKIYSLVSINSLTLL